MKKSVLLLKMFTAIQLSTCRSREPRVRDIGECVVHFANCQLMSRTIIPSSRGDNLPLWKSFTGRNCLFEDAPKRVSRGGPLPLPQYGHGRMATTELQSVSMIITILLAPLHCYSLRSVGKMPAVSIIFFLIVVQ